jgi:5-(carboxyamino)imidazole ribonucleotide synthase
MEFHQEANQVEYVICPARIDDKVADKARAIALGVSEGSTMWDYWRVEMFQTDDDEILINEVAPRPHNSGHYSIRGAATLLNLKTHLHMICPSGKHRQ